jgi:hypothetical protein
MGLCAPIIPGDKSSCFYDSPIARLPLITVTEKIRYVVSYYYYSDTIKSSVQLL